MKKRIVIFATVIVMTLSMFTGVTAANYDFPNNEAYYSSLCSSSAAPQNRTACLAYQQYVNQKVADAQKNLDAIKKGIADAKANIAMYAQQISSYEAQIGSLETDIAALEESITRTEANIGVLNVQITTRQTNIDNINASIKERMVAMQSFMTLNGYVDFVMGANSFTDLIRRVEGISDITAYDEQQMKLLTEQVALLNADKAEVEREKEALLVNKTNVETNKATVSGMKATVESILAQFRTQEAELEAQQNRVAADLSATQNKLKAISQAMNSIIPSAGWISPISSGFRISAGVWYYSGTSSIHLGVDFAASVGTSVKAVANGVVVYSANACPTYGYLGNTCGSPGSGGGGNQVYLFVSVNSRTYAVKYLHFERNTVISMGKIVNSGDVIGKVGSSGNSSGPHTHVEVIYLGTNTVSYYATRWNGDFAFGTGWSADALNYRCSVRAGAPCRENPLSIFGVTVGRSY